MSTEFKWIDSADIKTNESVLQKLIEVEDKLAARELLSTSNGPIREQLVKLYQSNRLVEDELVAEWLELYTTHTYWTRRDEEESMLCKYN